MKAPDPVAASREATLTRLEATATRLTATRLQFLVGRDRRARREHEEE